MATPVIQTDGTLAGNGTAGEGRKDFAIGEVITFSDTVVANSGKDHVWSLPEAPPGSGLTGLTDPLTETPTLAPDVTGTYEVVVTVGTLRAKILFAVVLPNSGMRMPALREQAGDYNEGGNTDSYHPDFVAGLRSIDGLLGTATAPNVPLTLAAAATTFVKTSRMMTITGDGGANTLATITGGVSGEELTLIFVDALVTITDDDSHTADTVDLSAAFTSADDTVLKLGYDGVSWYEVSRSVN